MKGKKPTQGGIEILTVDKKDNSPETKSIDSKPQLPFTLPADGFRLQANFGIVNFGSVLQCFVTVEAADSVSVSLMFSNSALLLMAHPRLR